MSFTNKLKSICYAIPILSDSILFRTDNDLDLTLFRDILYLYISATSIMQPQGS